VRKLSSVAKKAKVPRPPVQAPRRRGRAPSGSPLAALPAWGWGAGAAVVAAGIVAVVLAVGGGGSSAGSTAAVKAAMLAAGCTYRDVPPLPPRRDKLNYHADVPTLSTPTKGLWSTFPPSAGAHYGLWAVWGFYRSPVNPRQVVHNEEHGGVVIWWGPKVPRSTVDELNAFYDEQPVGVFGTPIAGLDDKIALTAWTGDPATYYRPVHGKIDYGMGHIAVCSRFDQKAFAAFRDAFRGKGPEGIPLADDKPGCGPQAACT
jgi:hypothetical protein